LTVIIGAKCKDGIILVADRKLTYKDGRTIFRRKIFGDLAHILMGYTGDAEMFDIFRKYTVGEVMINRDDNKRYTIENLLSKVSKSIKRFNEIGGKPFMALLVSHERNPPELYHIETNGNWDSVKNYRAIGSGEKTADLFCKELAHNKIIMKDFAKNAFIALMYMDRYCSGLGVGFEPDGSPDIKYLYYNKKEEWASEKDIKMFRRYADDKLKQFKNSLDVILEK
jgi:20S proteasome alpha/beta subunit